MRVVVANRNRGNLGITAIMRTMLTQEYRVNGVTYTSRSTLPSRSAMLVHVSYLPAGMRGIRILVSKGLRVVGKHVQAADIKDLVQFGGSRLVLRPRDGGRDLGSCRLIGEVGLLRSSQVGGGRDGASEGETGRRAQPEARADERCHCLLGQRLIARKSSAD